MSGGLVRIGAQKSPELAFCLFRIPPKGGRVLWQITNVCNYTCSYCIFSSGPGRPRGELDTARAIAAIEALAERGFSYLKFTGGEPFARKDFLRLMERASELGLEMDVSTNASLVTDACARRLAALTGLSQVHVSVDGPDAPSHEAARGPATFEPTVRGLIRLVEAGVRVRAGCALFEGNERQMPELAAACRDWGVAELIFSLMEPVGRLAGDHSMLCRRPPGEIAREAAALAARYAGSLAISYNNAPPPSGEPQGLCPGGRRFLFIDHLGRVSPCSWLVERDPGCRSELTLNEASLEEILRSRPITSFFESIASAAEAGRLGCPRLWS